MAFSSSVYVIILAVFVTTDFTYSYVCDDTSCDTASCDTSSKCFTTNTNLIIKNGLKCGCCDLCITQLSYDASCKTSAQNSIPKEQCGPELTCDSTTKRCRYRKESDCTCERLNYDDLRDQGFLVVGKHRPKCNYLGYYDSVKCITGSACFCVDETGKRIFGTDYESNEKSMLCNCSRDANILRQNLMNSEAFTYGDDTYASNPPFAHCLPNGNYDPLQCIGDNCFCLRKNLTIQGAVTSLDIKETMVCYDPAYHDESYFRVCEILRNYILKGIYNATLFDAEVLGLDIPVCSLDGFFAPVQCRGDKCYCVHKDGRRIPGYEAERYSDDAENMNCFCAIDRIYVTDPVYKKQVNCTSTGSYAPIQCQGSLCYCVDQYGIQQGGEVQRKKIKTLDCSAPITCST